MAAVGTPRYTRSLDDVSAQTADNCQECWHHDPNYHDCRIHQTLLSLDLQNVKLFSLQCRQAAVKPVLYVGGDDYDYN